MMYAILVGFVVVVLTVIIQGYTTMMLASRYMQYKDRLESSSFKNYGTWLLISTSVFLIFIHLVQASLWAVLYLTLPGISEIDTFEKAIYFSLVTFTTLGYGEITISSANRILSGLEAINGITLIGWSTAFMFAIVQELFKKRMKRKNLN